MDVDGSASPDDQCSGDAGGIAGGKARIPSDRGTAIAVTPLYGVHGEQALCYLLEMDGCRILLDCGWDDAMSPETLAPLAAIAPTVNAVLISHPDTAHLGALPYAFGKLGLDCRVYATLPVHKMGMMFMYDHYLARAADADFDLFTLDDVDTAFGAFVPVRYVQHSALSGKGLGITVTAYAAGHMLGGAVWKVHKEAEDVVYAVDYNHRKERHLDGTALSAAINRPSLLITDAFNAQGAPPAKSRDNDMVEAILRAVRQDGNVLIPMDPAGRVLELLLMLEDRWAQKQLGAYQLVLLTTVAYNTLEFARSHLEWMGENVGRSFDRDRHNAFNTRYLTLCHSTEELHALRPGPKVVLASFGSLEAGPSRHLFTQWASDPRNLVVLTDRTQPGSLAREVRDLSRRPPGAREPLQVAVSHRVPLEGGELRAWREAKAAARARAVAEMEAETRAEQAAADAADKGAAAQGMDIDGVGGDDDSSGDNNGSGDGSGVEGAAAATAAATDSLLGVAQVSGAGTRAAELRRRQCLVDGFQPPSGAAAPMFDNELWEPDMTDFGEAIDAEVFGRAMQEANAVAQASLDAPIAAPEGAAAAAAAANAAAASAAAVGDIPPPTPPPPRKETPSKVVTEVREVHLRAAVHACDYEGRADGRSVRTLVAHVEPRRVILVHGTSSDTTALAEHLRTSLPGVTVDVPAAGQAVDCTSHTAMYRLQLSQDLLSRTRLRDVAGYQVGWVDGIVGLALDGEGNEVPVLLAPTPAALGAGWAPAGGGDNDDNDDEDRDGDATAAAVVGAVAGAVAGAEIYDTSRAPRATEMFRQDGSAEGRDVATVVTAAAAAVALAAVASKERRRSAFVGDLKLSDFKLALAAAG
jgi:cleavage and polyadenylation specificity factor subunit 2